MKGCWEMNRSTYVDISPVMEECTGTLRRNREQFDRHNIKSHEIITVGFISRFV